MSELHLPEGTCIGRVRLRVADLDRSLTLYRDVLGLQASRAGESAVALSVRGGPERVRLEERPGTRPRSRSTTGLYHFALLVPDRRSLARALVRLRDSGWPVRGLSDHAVSEAIYLADPDGLGIEIYADRPRERWRRRADGEIQMTTAPLDLDDLLTELEPPPDRESEPDRRPRGGLPSGTTVGHIHLRVSDLEAAEAFYHGLLGFDVVVRSYPGALFFSAGGYHHHIGTNVWTSGGAGSAPEDEAGLIDYEIVIPASDALESARERLERSGHEPVAVEQGWRLEDPDRIGLVLIG